MELPKRKTKTQIATEAFKDLAKLFQKSDRKENETAHIKEKGNLNPTPILKKEITYTEKTSLYQKFEDSKIRSANSKNNSLFTPLISEK